MTPSWPLASSAACPGYRLGRPATFSANIHRSVAARCLTRSPRVNRPGACVHSMRSGGMHWTTRRVRPRMLSKYSRKALIVVICMGASARRFAREALEGIARQPIHGPVAHRPGAQALVEADGGFVPVEHPPLETTALALDRQLRQAPHERPPNAAAAMRREDEQILEVETALAEEGRVVVKEEREPRRVTANLGDQDLRGRPLAEQRDAQVHLCCHGFIRQPLVFGEPADEGENEREIGDRGEANTKFLTHVLGSLSALGSPGRLVSVDGSGFPLFARSFSAARRRCNPSRSAMSRESGSMPSSTDACATRSSSAS